MISLHIDSLIEALIADGWSTANIVKKLWGEGVSRYHVETIRRRRLERYDVKNEVDKLRYLVRKGVVP